MDHRLTPIFIDRSGRRWRRIRRVALVLGVVTTALAAGLVATLALSPPMPPELPLAVANNLPIARATTGRPGAFTRLDRLRVAYRRKLAAAIRQTGGTPQSAAPRRFPRSTSVAARVPPARRRSSPASS